MFPKNRIKTSFDKSSYFRNERTYPLRRGMPFCPGFYEKVERFNHIKYEAKDVNGNKFNSEASELLAVCIQHEIDHLDGKIFVDYLSDMKRSKIEKGLTKQKNNNTSPQRTENPYIK